MKNKTEIRIGKGKLSITESAAAKFKDSWLLIRIINEKGPCRDDMCQLIEKVKVTISSEKPPNLVALENGKSLNIGCSRVFMETVDRDRKSVKLYSSITNELKLKGY